MIALRQTAFIRAWAAAASLVALAVAGCSASNSSGQLSASALPAQSNTAETGSVQPSNLDAKSSVRAKIALLIPLTAEGQTAEIAKGLKQAGELALFEYNDPGLQLIVKDTAGTPEGARAAAASALESGAEIIIGPLFAKSVSAVADVARPANIPVIAFSSSEEVAGNGVFLLSFQARQELSRIVTFAAARGKSRFAALTADDAYGKVLMSNFQSAVRQANGTIVAAESYPPGANEMLERSQKLFETAAGGQDVGTSIDAIFVPGDELTLPTLGPIIGYTNVDTSRVKLIGNGGWDFRNLARTKAFVGGWYAAPDPAGWTSFSQRFARTFGVSPPRIATFAYDGVAIAATLAAQYPVGQRYSTQTLTQAAGFNGVDGPVRFLPSGLTERALAVLEVQEFGPQVIDPAPRAFGASSSTYGTAQTAAYRQ